MATATEKIITLKEKASLAMTTVKPIEESVQYDHGEKGEAVDDCEVVGQLSLAVSHLTLKEVVEEIYHFFIISETKIRTNILVTNVIHIYIPEFITI